MNLNRLRLFCDYFDLCLELSYAPGLETSIDVSDAGSDKSFYRKRVYDVDNFIEQYLEEIEIKPEVRQHFSDWLRDMEAK